MMATAARRNTELSLLILALFIGCGALALVTAARNEAKLSTAIPLIVVLLIAFVAAHIVVRRLAPQADSLFLPLAALLNSVGLAVQYRLRPGHYGPAQLVWTIVGLICFVATLALVSDYRILARYKYIFGFGGVGLLLAPLTPLGSTINGARLWIQAGGLSFQPGELAKVCLVVFFAAYLGERKELLAIANRRVLGFHVPDIKHFGPPLVM